MLVEGSGVETGVGQRGALAPVGVALGGGLGAVDHIGHAGPGGEGDPAAADGDPGFLGTALVGEPVGVDGSAAPPAAGQGPGGGAASGVVVVEPVRVGGPAGLPGEQIGAVVVDEVGRRW